MSPLLIGFSIGFLLVGGFCMLALIFLLLRGRD